MLGDSGLSKLEREMIAVAVSAVNHCHYCLTSHGAAVRQRAGDPVVGEQIAQNYRAANLPSRQKAMLDFTVRLTEAPDKIEAQDRQSAARGGLQRSRYLGHRRGGRLLQHVKPPGGRRRPAAQRRLSLLGPRKPPPQEARRAGRAATAALAAHPEPTGSGRRRRRRA